MSDCIDACVVSYDYVQLVSYAWCLLQVEQESYESIGDQKLSARSYRTKHEV